MLRTFNCGVGMVLVVEADAADAVQRRARRARRDGHGARPDGAAQGDAVTFTGALNLDA